MNDHCWKQSMQTKNYEVTKWRKPMQCQGIPNNYFDLKKEEKSYVLCGADTRVFESLPEIWMVGLGRRINFTIDGWHVTRRSKYHLLLSNARCIPLKKKIPNPQSLGRKSRDRRHKKFRQWFLIQVVLPKNLVRANNFMVWIDYLVRGVHQ